MRHHDTSGDSDAPPALGPPLPVTSKRGVHTLLAAAAAAAAATLSGCLGGTPSHGTVAPIRDPGPIVDLAPSCHDKARRLVSANAEAPRVPAPALSPDVRETLRWREVVLLACLKDAESVPIDHGPLPTDAVAAPPVPPSTDKGASP